MALLSLLWPRRWHRVSFLPGCRCGSCGVSEPHERRWNWNYTKYACRPLHTAR